jgi:dTMP kinase
MSKNSIIVFEGIEGTGKSHHINKIANFLKKIIKNLLKLENLVEA